MARAMPPTRQSSSFPFWGAIALPASALWGTLFGVMIGIYFGNLGMGAAIGAGLGIGVGLGLLAAAIVVASAKL